METVTDRVFCSRRARLSINQANNALGLRIETNLNSGESMFELVTAPHYRRA